MGMRMAKGKLFAVLTVFAALVVMAFPGCDNGENVARAKECMERGDLAMEKARAEGEEFKKVMDDQLANALAVSKPPQEPDFRAAMEQQLRKALELTEKSERIQTDYHEEARKEYGEINDLEGVTDYQSYAGTRIEEIDLRQGIMFRSLEFLDESAKELAAHDSSPEKWRTDYEMFKAEVEDAEKKADELAKEAEKTKAGKSL